MNATANPPTTEFTDRSFAISRTFAAPRELTWPLELPSTITFDEEGFGTKLTIRWGVLPSAARPSMKATRACSKAGRARSISLPITSRKRPKSNPMSTASTPITSADDRTVVTTRLIDAPRDLVFRLYREPEHLARCWGPNGFWNTFHEYDFRPGGHWRFFMHGPDGTDYPNHSVFDEVMAPERIVFRHVDDPQHQFQMTILLEERGAKTQLTWRMCFDSGEHLNAVRAFIVPANEQNFDRIEAELAKMSVS